MGIKQFAKNFKRVNFGGYVGVAHNLFGATRFINMEDGIAVFYDNKDDCYLDPNEVASLSPAEQTWVNVGAGYNLVQVVNVVLKDGTQGVINFEIAGTTNTDVVEFTTVCNEFLKFCGASFRFANQNPGPPPLGRISVVGVSPSPTISPVPLGEKEIKAKTEPGKKGIGKGRRRGMIALSIVSLLMFAYLVATFATEAMVGLSASSSQCIQAGLSECDSYASNWHSMGIAAIFGLIFGALPALAFSIADLWSAAKRKKRKAIFWAGLVAKLVAIAFVAVVTPMNYGGIVWIGFIFLAAVLIPVAIYCLLFLLPEKKKEE